MATLVVKLEVDVAPTRTDPHEVIEEILDSYEKDSTAGNCSYVVAERFLEAEWED